MKPLGMIHRRQCDYCGAEFESTSYTQKYCGHARQVGSCGHLVRQQQLKKAQATRNRKAKLVRAQKKKHASTPQFVPDYANEVLIRVH